MMSEEASKQVPILDRNSDKDMSKVYVFFLSNTHHWSTSYRCPCRQYSSRRPGACMRAAGTRARQRHHTCRSVTCVFHVCFSHRPMGLVSPGGSAIDQLRCPPVAQAMTCIRLTSVYLFISAAHEHLHSSPRTRAVYRWEVATVHTVCTLQPGEAGPTASPD